MKPTKATPTDSFLLTCALASAIAFVLGHAAIADAHLASSYYESEQWPADETYIVGNSGGLGTSNLQSAAIDAAADWNAIPSTYMDTWNGGINGVSGPVYGDCGQPSNDIWVYGGVVSGTAIANGATCASGGVLTQARIVFDSGESWYWGTGSAGTSHDARAVMTHEWGHVMGHFYHFTGSTLCPSNSGIHTMCQGQTTKDWKRSLEEHDEHTFQGKYY